MALFRQGSRVNQCKGVAAINQPIPEFGGLVISDTSLHTPPSEPGSGQRGWGNVYVITDTVFASGTVCNISGLVGVTIKAGTWLPAIFEQIKLASGSIIAYYAVEQNGS